MRTIHGISACGLALASLAFVAALAGAVGMPSDAAAAGDERHIGYYYPEPQTGEVYEARLPQLPGSNRQRRVGFVTVLTAEMLNRPYPPRFVVFAKGTDAEKMIITAVTDGAYNSLYRARALFAELTATARATPFFADQPDADRYTFFDLLALLGFEQLTFTDGKDFAHKVEFR